jgi:hypothetical protein
MIMDSVGDTMGGSVRRLVTAGAGAILVLAVSGDAFINAIARNLRNRVVRALLGNSLDLLGPRGGGPPGGGGPSSAAQPGGNSPGQGGGNAGTQNGGGNSPHNAGQGPTRGNDGSSGQPDGGHGRQSGAGGGGGGSGRWLQLEWSDLDRNGGTAACGTVRAGPEPRGAAALSAQTASEHDREHATTLRATDCTRPSIPHHRDDDHVPAGTNGNITAILPSDGGALGHGSRSRHGPAPSTDSEPVAASYYFVPLLHAAAGYAPSSILDPVWAARLRDAPEQYTTWRQTFLRTYRSCEETVARPPPSWDALVRTSAAMLGAQGELAEPLPRGYISPATQEALLRLDCHGYLPPELWALQQWATTGQYTTAADTATTRGQSSGADDSLATMTTLPPRPRAHSTATNGSAQHELQHSEPHTDVGHRAANDARASHEGLARTTTRPLGEVATRTQSARPSTGRPCGCCGAPGRVARACGQSHPCERRDQQCRGSVLARPRTAAGPTRIDEPGPEPHDVDPGLSLPLTTSGGTTCSSPAPAVRPSAGRTVLGTSRPTAAVDADHAGTVTVEPAPPSAQLRASENVQRSASVPQQPAAVHRGREASAMPVAAEGDFSRATTFPLPPAALAEKVLEECGGTTPHVPKAVRGAWSALLLRWYVDLAWRLAHKAAGGEHDARLTAYEVGHALIFGHNPSTPQIRERIELAARADFDGLERLVDEQRGRRRHPRPRPDAQVRRARRLIEEGCVGRAISCLDTNPAAVQTLARSDEVVHTLRALFPQEPEPTDHCASTTGSAATNSSDHRAPAALPPPRVDGPLCLPYTAASDVQDWHVRQASDRASRAAERSHEQHVSRHGDEVDENREARGGRCNGEEADWTPWERVVSHFLTKRGRLTAPGPLGQRAEYTREAMTVRANGRSVVQALACVMSLMVAGHVPEACRDSRLFALPKTPIPDPQKVRPIGAGDCLRSMASSLVAGPLAQSLEVAAAEAGQFGMSRAGTQRAATRVRALVEEGYTVLSVDVENAFNTITRAEILRMLPVDAPGRALVLALYGSAPNARPPMMHMPLRPDCPIACTRGVIQGCPLAALLFANALTHGAIRRAIADADNGGISVSPAPAADLLPQAVRRGPEDVYVVFYADDGYVAARGPRRWELLSSFGELIESRMTDVGMRIARGPTKTAYLSTSPMDAPPPGSWIEQNAAATDVLRSLGSPVSRKHEDEPARTAVIDIVREAIAVVRGIIRLRDPHHMLTAVRLAGVWTRIEYVVTTTPRRLVPAWLLQEAEAADMEVLSHALGPHGRALDARGWLCAGLPIAKGGLGLRLPTAEAARCMLAARARIARADGLPWPADQLPDESQAEREAAKIFGGIVRHASPNEEIMLRGHADKGGISGAWLQVPLNREQGTHECPIEVATALAQRLLLPVYGDAIPDSGQPCPAACATRGVCDPQGHHTLGCTATTTPRHNEIRDRIHRFLTVLGRDNANRESHCASDGTPIPGEDGDRPGDVTYRVPGRQQWNFLDVGVRSLVDPLVEAARRDPRALARNMFDEKKRDIGHAVLATGAQYFPIALGCNGTIDPRSLSAIRAAALVVDQISPFRPGPGELSAQRRLLRDVSAALAVGNARGIVKTRSSIPELHNFTSALSQAEACALVHHTFTMRIALTSAAGQAGVPAA